MRLIIVAIAILIAGMAISSNATASTTLTWQSTGDYYHINAEIRTTETIPYLANLYSLNLDETTVWVGDRGTPLQYNGQERYTSPFTVSRNGTNVSFLDANVTSSELWYFDTYSISYYAMPVWDGLIMVSGPDRGYWVASDSETFQHQLLSLLLLGCLAQA